MPDQTNPKPPSKTLKTVGFAVLALFVVLFILVPVLRNVFQGL